ncbi:MoaD/ThiS family protein [Lewinella sp. IMCC34191]|uniref:MoaD/ThiS family protein n=1 Tax=Lewinella sp. IMCC34191 TaxID=2259172 RepID=UPI001E54A9CD|nr:MoaD/ThiS family protein [Lewinella sp. IMCC34191]
MRIQCFGVAREIAGGSSITLDQVEGATVADLRQRLVATYPAFGELVSFAIARNEEYARDEEQIMAGDELVIIPPVAGG